MASQIMETIAATERACDEKKQAAKEKATAIADEAQKKCEDMRAEAAAFARRRRLRGQRRRRSLPTRRKKRRRWWKPGGKRTARRAKG